jgi:hypothetical protein
MFWTFALIAAANAIPAPYLGSWSQDPAACGGEDTRGVTITPTHIDFYEARGTVRSASEGAKGASARVDFEGEGRKWQEGVRFRPLPGGKLELTALGGTHIFHRCPAKR